MNKLNHTLVAIFFSLIPMTNLATPVAAGTFEDAVAADDGGDYATALRLYRSLAEQGNAMAQVNLGLMYSKGQGVQQNHFEATKWFRLAANQGNAKGQCALGSNYARGEGVPQDYAEAVKWLRRAANQGDAMAQSNLGIMYVAGQGVTPNYVEAAKWWRLAANRGYAKAQFKLGLAYGSGLGVPQNYVLAYMWYALSAAQGYEGADVMRDKLASLKMTASQIAEAQKLAAQWQPQASNEPPQADAILQAWLKKNRWMSNPMLEAKAHAIAQRLADRGIGGIEQLQQVENEIVRLYPDLVADYGYDVSGIKPKRTEPKAPNTSLAEITPRQFQSKPETAATSGTAFFVSDRGDVLTNAHVVEGCQQISVGGTPARLLASDQKNDLALLGTDHRAAQWAFLRQSAKLGEDIVVYGFPLSGVLSSSGNVVTGNITALAGLGDDTRYLQISAPVQPGNSGGPLFDRHGDVVGVVVGELDAVKIASATGDIPQNVNFAIKASVATAFLDAQRITTHDQYAEVAAATGPLSTPDIAARAQALAVQVVCVR